MTNITFNRIRWKDGFFPQYNRLLECAEGNYSIVSWLSGLQIQNGTNST